MATRGIAFGYSDVGDVTCIIKNVDGEFWNPTTNRWQSGSVSCDLSYDSVMNQYYLEENPSEGCRWTAFDDESTPIATGVYGNIAGFSFGWTNVGAVDSKIKRASDGYFWNSTTNAWQSSEVSCSMTFDSDLIQYYSNEQPTESCYWTAFDGSIAIAYGGLGGGFPDTDAVSNSIYTMQEVLDRIRIEISDPDSDGSPRFSDAQLLGVLDRCVGWLTDQCYKKKTTVGAIKATFTGDGTTEWSLPAGLYGLLYFVDPTLKYGGQLKQATKLDYDRGDLANSLSRTEYYALLNNNLYFMTDLATDSVINLYYYPKISKLATSTVVPFDGLFIDLMVEWGKTITLATDEFSIDRFQGDMLGMFMRNAKAYMVTRSAGPMRARVRQREVREVRRGKLT